MKTADKPKVKETGVQVAAAGVIGTVLTAVLPAVDVAADAIDFGTHGWIGVAGVAIGVAYRGFCKWLDTRGFTIDEDAVDKIYSAGEDVYEAVDSRAGGD